MPVRSASANGEQAFFKQKAKKGQQIFIDTADNYVITPVAFFFSATEEDLRLEHIP